MGHYAPMPRGRWVIASFIPIGWLTWVGLGYAGFRAKRPLWVAFGVMYGLIAAAAIVITEADENINSIEDDLGYLLMFLGWGAGSRIPSSSARPTCGGWRSWRIRRYRPRGSRPALRGRVVFLPR